MRTPRKTRTINLRIEPEHHDLIAQAASLGGHSVTAYMTEAALLKAREDLIDRRFIDLSADAFAEISAALDGPGEAQARLVRLFSTRRDWLD